MHGFQRDASGRLSFELTHIAREEYPAICNALAARFRLELAAPEIDGLDCVIREYARNGRRVGLEWDNWSGFILVAMDACAEPLLWEMAASLCQGPGKNDEQ